MQAALGATVVEAYHLARYLRALALATAAIPDTPALWADLIAAAVAETAGNLTTVLEAAALTTCPDYPGSEPGPDTGPVGLVS
jgi:hypothetical protein